MLYTKALSQHFNSIKQLKHCLALTIREIKQLTLPHTSLVYQPRTSCFILYFMHSTRGFMYSTRGNALTNIYIYIYIYIYIKYNMYIYIYIYTRIIKN